MPQSFRNTSPISGNFGVLLIIACLAVVGVAGYVFAPAGSQGFGGNKFLGVSGGPLLAPGFKDIHSTVLSALHVASVRVPVLMYHYIRPLPEASRDPVGYGLSTTPENFRRQMEYLVNKGYHTTTPHQLVAALRDRMPLPKKPVMLTFDDGYEDFYRAAFPILREFGLQSTAFVITEFVGDSQQRYLTWEQIIELERSGLVTFGAHTLSHEDLVTASDAVEQIIQSKKILEDKLDTPVTAFAYPSGQFNEHTVQLVKDAGYELAFTTRYGGVTPAGNLWTLPRVRISGGVDMEQFSLRVGLKYKVRL